MNTTDQFFSLFEQALSDQDLPETVFSDIREKGIVRINIEFPRPKLEELASGFADAVKILFDNNLPYLPFHLEIQE